MFEVLTSISIIMLSIVIVIIIYFLRIIFDVQIKILKNHYRIQGQIELLTSMIAPLESGIDPNIFSFVMPQAMSETAEHSEKTDTTTVEVDMDSKVTSPVKEVDQTNSDNDELLSAQS
jgi:hypothetical protein